MDARSPLVVSTHDLGRRPGAARELHVSAPAPKGLGTEVIAVPEGAELDADLRLEAVMDGVFVTGTVRTKVHGECVRCLRDIDDTVDVRLDELVYYPKKQASLIDDGDEEAAELPVLEGELLDLEPLVRDAVVLMLPFQPLCRPDCAGLCDRCGVRLDDAGPDHHHEELDPRWSELGELLADRTPEQGAGE